jgi:DNA-binding winged helix-turn-helix (wHTH) protein
MLSYGKVLVDTFACKVTYDGIIIPLLPKEYQLLSLFLKHPHHVLSYEFIVDQIWEIGKSPMPNSIRSHIKSLRKAFKEANISKDIIETVHGIGYRLNPLEEDKFIIPPSPSVIKKIIKAKAIEYVVINEKFIIKYLSPCLIDYCDYPEALKIGSEVGDAFPELIGLEEVLDKLIKKEYEVFEIKGIARVANPNRPTYINLSIILDNSKKLARQADKLLFIFFEDASEQMFYKQRIVQLENESYLMLEVERNCKNCQ